MQERSPQFDADLMSMTKRLKQYAVRLTRSSHNAEDLVSETVVRAIEHHDKFVSGTNMAAWLHTIMYRVFITRVKRAKREVEDVDGAFTSKLSVAENQTWVVDAKTYQRFAKMMPAPMRDAFNAVVIDEMSYEDAAAELGTTVGTIKSRVNRAKEFLDSVLNVERVLEPLDVEKKEMKPESHQEIMAIYKGGASINEIRAKFQDLSRLEIMEIIAGMKR